MQVDSGAVEARNCPFERDGARGGRKGVMLKSGMRARVETSGSNLQSLTVRTLFPPVSNLNSYHFDLPSSLLLYLHYRYMLTTLFSLYTNLHVF